MVATKPGDAMAPMTEAAAVKRVAEHGGQYHYRHVLAAAAARICGQRGPTNPYQPGTPYWEQWRRERRAAGTARQQGE